MNEENNTSPNIGYAPMDVYCIGCKNRKLVRDCMYNGDLKKIVTVWTCEHQEACNDVYKYCMQKIGEQLNMRKKGKWICWYEEIENDTCTEYIPHCKCSECGTEYDSHTVKFINFCNHCGADMRGAEHG